MHEKILLIDDDNRNIYALKAILSARGYFCYSAISSREGLRFLEDGHDIGIVLLDMMMPDIDGYETISIIRNTISTREIPIIAVTAQAMAGDREKCIEAGADEYISKPVDIDLLVQYLHKYLKK